MKKTHDLTLNQTLASLGLSHRLKHHMTHEVLDRSGCVLFSGDVGAIWVWLRREGKIS